MGDIKLGKEEVVILEENVSLGNIQNVNLLLTNKEMIFRREKGLFRKQLRVIDEILLDDIKVYNDKIQISQEKSSVVIQTEKKEVTFTCNNILIARKIIEEVIKIKTGSNILERGINKLGNLANKVNKSKDSLKAIGGAVILLAGLFGFSNRKK